MRKAVTVLSVAAGLAYVSTAAAQIHTIDANTSDTVAILMAQTTQKAALAGKARTKPRGFRANPHTVMIKTGPDTQRWYYITGVDSVGPASGPGGTSCGSSKACKMHLGGSNPENAYVAKLGGSQVFTIKDCSLDNTCP